MGKCLQVFLAIVCILVGNVLYISTVDPVSNKINYKAKQIEITTGGDLLRADGSLIDRGFARQPLKELNEKDIIPFLSLKQLSFLRYKKWDFFDIITPDYQLLVHVADLGYGGNVQISFVNYKTGDILSISDVVTNPMKLPALPTSSPRYESDYVYKTDAVRVAIKQTPNSSSTEHLVDIDFESTIISGKVQLRKTIGEDELVMLTPISEDGKHFYYNTKSYGLKSSGNILVNNKPYTFSETEALGGRDIGRGVWNYDSYWFWAHGQGFVSDKTGALTVPFGIDLGNGFEHESTETYEDCVIMGGRLHKLGVVRREISETNPKADWIIKTDKQGVVGSLNAVFKPVIFAKKEENLILVQAKFKQFFGEFSGTFVNENGETVSFDKIYGFAEVHRAKW